MMLLLCFFGVLKIRDYENGTATPNGAVINKIEKALGTKVR